MELDFNALQGSLGLHNRPIKYDTSGEVHLSANSLVVIIDEVASSTFLLPKVSSQDALCCYVAFVTANSAPSITVTSDIPVKYDTTLTFDVNRYYILKALFQGSCWVVSEVNTWGLTVFSDDFNEDFNQHE